MLWIAGGIVAEKSSVCRSVGMRRIRSSMSGRKPMSSMRSASSSTSTSTSSKLHRTAVGQVEEPSGRGDQHVDALAQRVDLLAQRRAAVDDERAQRRKPGDTAGLSGDLDRQLAGRRQHDQSRVAACRALAAGARRPVAGRRWSCRSRSVPCRARLGPPLRGGWPEFGWGWELRNRALRSRARAVGLR